MRYFFRFFFLFLFLFVFYYITYLKTEKYESRMTVIIKDLSQEQSVSPFASLLTASGSESSQDAKLLEVYIKSDDMYELLDKEFNLTDYYSSEEIDILNRLSNRFILPFYEESRVNFLEKYREDLKVIFDEPSSTIEVAFAHKDNILAKNIVEDIIQFAGDRLNYFDKKNFEVVLNFLKKEETEKYALFLTSLRKLLHYQNRHNTINPKVDVELKSSILANLEGELVQKEVLYNSQLQYLKAKVPEMKLLKNTIINIRKKIQKLKHEIVGNKDGKKLNENLSDFELLKSEVEFNKQIYMQVLAKLEETSVHVSQNSKNLIIVSSAKVSDSYDYPKKLQEIISIFIVLSFIYGILSFILILIKDHKD